VGKRKLTLALSAILLLFLTAFCFTILSNIVSTYSAYPFDTDEAVQSLSALEIAQDLKEHSFSKLCSDLYRRGSYPPFAAVLRSLLFLAIGASTYSARMLSPICFVISLWLLFLIGINLDREYGWFIGFLAVVVTLTSIPFLTLASEAMLEIPGLMTSMFALWIYMHQCDRERTWALDVSVGMAVAIVMLTKYPYGIVLLSAVSINEIIEALLRRRAPLKKWLLTSCTFLVPMIYWFWQPWKIDRFFRYATIQPHNVDFLSIENLMFYPRVIFLHYSPSIFFSLLALLGIIWSFLKWRDSKIRSLLLYSLIGCFMVTLKTQNEVRFVSTFIPALYLLIGAALTDIWFMAKQKGIPLVRHRGTKLIMIVALAASIAPAHSALQAIGTTLEASYETDPRLSDVASWIYERTAGHPICVVDPWDQLSIASLRWHMEVNTKPGSKQQPPIIRQHRLARQESMLDLLRLIAGARSKYLVVLQREGSRWPRNQNQIDGLISMVGKLELEYGYSHQGFGQYHARGKSSAQERATKSLTVLLYEIQVPREDLTFETADEAQSFEELVWPDPQINIPLNGVSERFGECLGETVRLEFDRKTTKHALLVGWSGFERTGNGESYVWAVGHEASLILICCHPRKQQLSIRLWPYPGMKGEPQRIRGLLNGQELGVAELKSGPQIIRVATRGRHWRKGNNLLVLQFLHAIAPSEVQNESTDKRLLTAAFDWLELSDQ
jgi:hypothetical protein